jgi:formylglycine-generating enzyme required for sulfatase activity
MNGKIMFVGLVMMILMAGTAMGQYDCYNPTMRAAKASYDKGDYRRAEQLYREASECYDCTAQQKAQAKRKAEESKKALQAKQDTQNSGKKQEKPTSSKTEKPKCDKPVKVSSYKSGDDEIFTVGKATFKMVWVEGGTFTMGCTSEQGGDCSGDEYPAHSMTVSSYYMGETEVTQALWKVVMEFNFSYFEGDNLPVDDVSWNQVQEFIEKLNQLTGRTFRLPTEAEWEYAARGGSKSRGYKYSGSNSIDAVAWYKDNSGEKTHPVKRKQANELGLYDMSGNVEERCSDGYNDYYGSESQNDSGGSSTGSILVVRGGHWNDVASSCRVSFRSGSTPNSSSNFFGFRLVLCP